MIRRAVMIEAVLAGLRIDRHAADGIENLSMIRVGVRMVMIVMIVMMCVRAVGLCLGSLLTAATRYV